MAFNVDAPLTYLTTLCESAPGNAQVYTGVPLGFATTTAIYCAVGGSRITRKATSSYLQREQRYLVVFGYRTGGQSEPAEHQAAAFGDWLLLQVYTDPTLGGTVQAADVDGTLAQQPQYATVAGSEYRLLPLEVVTTQTQTIS